MNIIDYTDGMKVTPPCIIRGMPNEVYHAADALSKSALDLFDRSPAHLAFAEPFKTSRAMVIGTAIHTALLEPERFKDEYVLLTEVTDRRSSVYKEAIKHHAEENVLTGTEAANVHGMTETAKANPDFAAYTSKPHHVELSFFGVCKETGTSIKCRFDLLTEDGHALDVKKTRDSRYDDFSRSIMNYRYHVQHAFYSYVYECVTGEPLKSFVFFAIEENSPHTNVIYRLCHESITVGKELAMRGIKDYAACDNPAASIWGGEQVISLPEWYLNQYAQDEIYMGEE